MKEKICASCKQVKPVDEFEENQYSPDGRYLICRACFEKRMKFQPPVSKPQNSRQKNFKSDIDRPAAAGFDAKAGQASARAPQPKKTGMESKNTGRLTKDIRRVQEELLSDSGDESLQAGNLLPRLRKCNGCKKVEPADRMPPVPPTPVQAWFCRECIRNKKHQYVGKGYLVYDFWGRIYKVTRVLNNELVRGVVKKKDGRWSIRKFNIYGHWLTKKPL